VKTNCKEAFEAAMRMNEQIDDEGTELALSMEQDTRLSSPCSGFRIISKPTTLALDVTV
jgi:hypothetical protein